MKKSICIALFVVLGVVQVNAQTKSENYVKTTAYHTAVTLESQVTQVSDTISSVTYYDGLGRPKQQIAVGQSPNGSDIITPITYDGFGRQDKEYLPYAGGANGTGDYNSNAVDEVLNFYNTTKYENTANPYSQKEFEASPLNRVFKQAAPGQDWALGSNHEIKFDYSANTAADGVKLYEVVFTDNNKELPTLVNTNNANYPAGELYKNITKDENHIDNNSKDHTTEEFTNILGQVILKRTFESEVTHNTYYVYDDYGNLTYVIPPGVDNTDGVSDSELAELCYQYVYDYRNRLVEKKIPGKDWEYIVYNTLDQPVLTQDALLRENNEWLFTKYDAFGRVAFTGLHRQSSGTTVSRSVMQGYANDTQSYTKWVENTTNAQSLAGTSIYYTNGAVPHSVTEIYTINYYDDYDYLQGYTLPTTVFGVPVSNKTKTLATGSKVRVLGTNDWVLNVLAYDDKGRNIFTYTENEYLNTFDETETQYDFVGKVLKTRTRHIKDSNTPIVTQDVFTYDHAGRLIDQHQCIGDDTLSEFCGEANSDIVAHLIIKDEVITESSIETATEEITFLPDLIIEATDDDFEFIAQINEGELQGAELIAENTYDELGQLESKKVGNTKASPLQTVDYTYNIRGWLKGINDTSTLGNDLFSFKLNYNTTDLSGSTALFNGNISETHWKTANDNTARNYRYGYDALNRITGAISNEPTKYNVLGIAYDKMGNIESLTRKGAVNSDATSFGTMDNLDYLYLGNQLQSVTELQDGNIDFGFKDGNTSGNDYAYDDNGNMITDLNKGIQSISYNHLNLPTFIEVNAVTEDGSIQYVYDAAGIKHQKHVFENGVAVATTDYAGNFVYENEELKFGNHPEGYIEPTNGTDAEDGFAYVYQYKDHLGNIRLSYADADNDGSVDIDEIREEKNYYPFGLQQKGYEAPTSHREHNYGFQGEEECNDLGMNTIAYQWRDYDPAIGRFNKIDRYAEKYLNISVYGYTANNPVRYREVAGDSLQVVGTENALDQLTDNLQTNLGGLYDVNINDETGHVTLSRNSKEGDLTKKQGAFLKQLNKVISNSKTTNFTLLEKGESFASDGVRIGDNGARIESFITGSHVIDMGDVNAFPNLGNGKVSSAGILSHELEEGFQMQVNNKTSEQGHLAGFTAQANVDGLRIYQTAKFNESGTQLKIPVISKNSNNQGVSSTIEVNFQNNDITTINQN